VARVPEERPALDPELTPEPEEALAPVETLEEPVAEVAAVLELAWDEWLAATEDEEVAPPSPPKLNPPAS
jgi:hypothetical protein